VRRLRSRGEAGGERIFSKAKGGPAEAGPPFVYRRPQLVRYAGVDHHGA